MDRRTNCRMEFRTRTVPCYFHCILKSQVISAFYGQFWILTDVNEESSSQGYLCDGKIHWYICECLGLSIGCELDYLHFMSERGDISSISGVKRRRRSTSEFQSRTIIADSFGIRDWTNVIKLHSLSFGGEFRCRALWWNGESWQPLSDAVSLKRRGGSGTVFVNLLAQPAMETAFVNLLKLCGFSLGLRNGWPRRYRSHCHNAFADRMMEVSEIIDSFEMEDCR
jgi:hypothetical protein